MNTPPMNETLLRHDQAQTLEALHTDFDRHALHLNAEMTVIRKGLEAAFDHMEKLPQPVDYGTDIAKLTQATDTMIEHIKTLEASPVLVKGPDYYTEDLSQKLDALLRQPIATIEDGADHLHGATTALSRYVQAAKDRTIQDLHLKIAAGVGFGVGVLALFLIPRILPFNANTFVAAGLMGQDRWNAGQALMQLDKPMSWNEITHAATLVDQNRDTLKQCQRTATETGKAQRCIIIVQSQ